MVIGAGIDHGVGVVGWHSPGQWGWRRAFVDAGWNISDHSVEAKKSQLEEKLRWGAEFEM